MANTFYLDTKSGKGTYQGRYLKLECTQTIDVATNKSTIHWVLSSVGGIDNNYSTGPTTVTINGVQAYYKSRTEYNTYTFPAARGSVSGDIVIDHNMDGSKTINVSVSTAVWYGSAQVQTYSGTWTLDNIPREAKITAASDFTDVDNPSITFSNPGGFRMDVWLEPNPVGDHLCVKENIPNTGSYTWVLTDEERDELRRRCAGNSCPIRLGLYSYPGGVQIADYKDKTYTITENEKTKPSVGISISNNNGTLPSKFDGLYIQGKSKVNVSLTCGAYYNSSIEDLRVEIEGKEYDGWNPTITSSVIQGSGEVTIIGYAKDSRKFTGSASDNINVIPYSKPLVIPLGSENAIQCYRSDGNGKRTGNSTSVWVKAKKSFYTVNGINTCALQWRRKLINEAWDEEKHIWNDLPADEYNALLTRKDGLEEEFDLTQAYIIQIRAIDDIGESDTKTLEIPTQDVALHLGAGGKNVSVGTYCNYSTPYTFFSDWVGIFDKGLYGASLNNNVTDVLTFAEEATDGLTPIIINDSTNKATLPEGNYGYSVGVVHKRAADQYNVILMDYVTGKIAINVHLSGTWTGWKYITPQ